MKIGRLVDDQPIEAVFKDLFYTITGRVSRILDFGVVVVFADSATVNGAGITELITLLSRARKIGINTAIASPTGAYAGYSFAVPAEIVKKVRRPGRQGRGGGTYCPGKGHRTGGLLG